MVPVAATPQAAAAGAAGAAGVVPLVTRRGAET